MNTLDNAGTSEQVTPPPESLMIAPETESSPAPSGSSTGTLREWWRSLLANNVVTLYEIVETIVLAIVIWLAVDFVSARFIVEGNSMEPNLHTGQYLIVSRLAYYFGEPHRGDVVVFRFPENPAEDYVKRIIGLPGETVTIQDAGVYINGVLIEEPYLSSAMPPYYEGRWVVPEGFYFVMGDNRPHSSDSRSWGLVEESLIIGKAWLSYWPPPEWGIVPHYSYDQATP